MNCHTTRRHKKQKSRATRVLAMNERKRETVVAEPKQGRGGQGHSKGTAEHSTHLGSKRPLPGRTRRTGWDRTRVRHHTSSRCPWASPPPRLCAAQPEYKWLGCWFVDFDFDFFSSTVPGGGGGGRGGAAGKNAKNRRKERTAKGGEGKEKSETKDGRKKARAGEAVIEMV